MNTINQQQICSIKRNASGLNVTQPAIILSKALKIKDIINLPNQAGISQHKLSLWNNAQPASHARARNGDGFQVKIRGFLLPLRKNLFL